MTHKMKKFSVGGQARSLEKCSRYAVKNLRCYSRWQGLNVYIDMEELLHD